jgi:hypothetical protein
VCSGLTQLVRKVVVALENLNQVIENSKEDGNLGENFLEHVGLVLP